MEQPSGIPADLWIFVMPHVQRSTLSSSVVRNIQEFKTKENNETHNP